MARRRRRLRLRLRPLIAVVAGLLPAAACADPGSSPAAKPPVSSAIPAGPAKPAAPPAIAFRVAATYPHDPGAFTQGLLVDRGRLLESTGQHGESSLREVEVATGRVLRHVPLARAEFGEGLALAGDRLFQLTWRNGVVLLWNPATFERVGALPLDGEGWGLAFDGRELVQSDGTDRLTFRSPKTFAPTRTVAVTRDGARQFYLNELEWLDGAVWANVWMSDEIVRIDPATGRVTGVLDASSLLTGAERERADVLNGIAWDPAKKLLYVTGKYWPKLFALELR